MLSFTRRKACKFFSIYQVTTPCSCSRDMPSFSFGSTLINIPDIVTYLWYRHLHKGNNIMRGRIKYIGEILILAMLRPSPQHGYDIKKDIDRAPGGMVSL